MITLSPARVGIAVGAILVVVAATVASLVLFAAGKAGEVDLTSAEFVPAGAGVYVALNTDLSSSSWVTAFKLAERLGADTPEDSLKDAVADASLDWEDDIAPFLGGNAALYVRSIDVEFLQVGGGLVVKCNDCARAVRVIRRESGLDFENRTYEGFDYLDGGGLYIAGAKDHLLVAMDEASLFEMLDLAAGKGESLASTSDFKRLRDELSPDFLAFVYISAEQLAVESLLDDEVIREAFDQAGIGDIALKPMALAIGARADGFTGQAAAVGDPGSSSPMLAPHEATLASLVPPTTAVFLNTSGISQTWDAAVSGSRDRIDDAIRESGEFDSLDDALRTAGEALGLDSLEDVIHQLTGETALAVWFPEGTEEVIEGVFLARVADAAETERILAALTDSAGGAESRDIGGTRVTFAPDGSAAFAVRDGIVYIGTAAGVEAVLELDGPGLAGEARYRSVIEGSGLPTGTFAYIDLPTVLRLAAGGIVPELDEAEAALGPALINLVSDKGLARLLAFVSVPE